MKNIANEKGITLIALAVTMVVMIILAGIAIKAGLSEDSGLITEVKKETDTQQEMIDDEQNKMNDVINNQLKDWGF